MAHSRVVVSAGERFSGYEVLQSCEVVSFILYMSVCYGTRASSVCAI